MKKATAAGSGGGVGSMSSSSVTGAGKRGAAVETSVVVGIFGNILSVVGVVLCNKYIITQGFNYTMILGACHFAFTWLGCHVMLRLGHFQYKAAALKNLLPVAVGSLGSVAFMNLNLAYNSVGFYQLSKLMCIPFTIAVQRLVFRQEASRAVKLTLVPILLGVGLATVHDVAVNLAGTVFAIVAVVFTTFSQIFTQRYQAALECNALQLLYLTSPLICLGMVLLAPFFDNVGDFQAKYLPARLGGLGPDTLPVVGGDRLLGGGRDDDDGGITATVASGAAAGEGSEDGGLAVYILISCVLALGVNVSNYLVLGKTSPLTYQVLGHLKTVLILVLGVVLFHSAVDLRQTLGIAIAMAGVVSYTEVKRRQATRRPSKLPR